MQQTTDQRWYHPALGAVLAFVALGAIVGGFGLVSSPDGSNLGMSTSILRGTPFTDFTIPGLLLLVVIGIGSGVGALIVFCRHYWSGVSGMLFGGALLIWITVQVLMLGLVSWMQPVYWLLGAAELLLGYLIRRGEMASSS